MIEPTHAAEGRRDPLLPNAWLIAKREFRERVRTKLFVGSTVLLALLAVGMAMTPVIIRAADRGSTTRIAVVTSEDHLADEILGTMGGALNASTGSGQSNPYTLVRAGTPDTIAKAVSDGEYNGALIATRQASGLIEFQFISGESIGADRLQYIGVGAIAVAILDWADRSRGQLTGATFAIPTVDVVNAIGSSAGRAPVQASEFAARRIVGVVFVVLIFITLVIYGMWVAAGVVSEKTSRVMELLISAASPAQLVAGKVVGIGLAGFVQYLAILVPAVITILAEDRISEAVLGSGSLTGVSLAVLSPSLLLAYGGFWVLGFILYSLIYAAAGSLVSRAEDLQVLALPLSLIAIVGYLMAVLALSGGISGFMKLASFVPFWSPFIMLTRMTIGRADPWEVALAFGLLVAAIGIVAILAVRVYSAGVLLYGQRPGLRAIAAAVIRPQG